MNMIAWMLLLCSCVSVVESALVCSPGSFAEVELPAAPSSGYLWVHDSSRSEAVCMNGVLGEYRASDTQSVQVFQVQCPSESVAAHFELRATWTREVLQTYEVEISGRAGSRGD